MQAAIYANFILRLYRLHGCFTSPEKCVCYRIAGLPSVFQGLYEGTGVIRVSRLNGTEFFINAELIQVVESTPDTIISLTTGVKVIVHEPASEVVKRVIEYRRRAYTNRYVHSADKSGSGE